MANVVIPGIPDVNTIATMEDPQLKELLIAIKLTLEVLTGANINSNSALIDLLNANQ